MGSSSVEDGAVYIGFDLVKVLFDSTRYLERNISVEIRLNNIGPISVNRSITEDTYEEGLEYLDVVAEIIQRPKKYYQNVQDRSLRTKNLYYCGLVISDP